MPTNYLFAGLGSSLRPQTQQTPKTNFAQSTQDLTSGVVARPSVGSSPTVQQNTSTFSPSSDGVILQNARNRNAQANQFGSDITAIQQADKQNKEAASARQQSQIATTPNAGPTDISQTSAVYSQRATGSRQELVSQATSLLGTPYAWGGGGYHNRSSHGTGLGTENVVGVDCSGLTSYAYGQLGIKIPRVAAGQLTTMGYKTNVRNLAPGDLVGWNGLGHVAMYIGNGQIVESPKVGATVRVRSLGASDTSRGVFGVHVKLPGE